MTPRNNILRQAPGPKHSVGQRTVGSQLAKPGAVQLKMAMAPQVKKQPVAPPVYRPQTAPRVLQGKLVNGQRTVNSQPGRPGAMQLKMAIAPQVKKQPVVPPVYRPQAAPRVLQGKLVASQHAHSHQLHSMPNASSPSCTQTSHKCLPLRTAERPQPAPPRTFRQQGNPLQGHLVQPRMQTPSKYPVANSIRTPHLLGGNAIQPMMSTDVIQAWPEWANYVYNGLVSLSSAGAIATGIATACQASGLGLGIPAIIGAVPAIVKLIIDRVSRENRSYTDGKAYSVGPILTDLASQVATILLPPILAIAGASAGSAAVVIGTLSAIFATGTWALMSYFTDNYEMWEKTLAKAMLAKCRSCCNSGYDELPA